MATHTLQNGHGQTPLPAIYFLSLTVNNFRAFGPEPVTLDLTDGRGNYAPWTILLGDNGTGKTSLLQCLAAVQPIMTRGNGEVSRLPAAMHEPPPFMREFRGGFHEFGRDGQVVAKIGQRSSESQKFGFSFVTSNTFNLSSPVAQADILVSRIHKVDEFYQAGANQLILETQCFGYGASRRMSRNAVADGLGKDACQTLFDDTADLINAEDWLIRADYATKLGQGNGVNAPSIRLNRIIQILTEVLPDVSGFEYGMTGENGLTPFLRAKTPSGWVRVANLSLGYKTTLAWVVDFAARMFERYPKSDNPLAEPAVCLVDEIDLHLHPRWQRKLIADLSRIFPKTQFIVTAHSPLIVQAAPDANLALLQWKGDHVIINNDVDHIRKWRVDQILASELFGGQPVHAPEVEALLQRRTKILSKPRLTKQDNKELAKVNTQLKELPTAALPDDPEAIDLIRETAELLRAKNGA